VQSIGEKHGFCTSKALPYKIFFAAQSLPKSTTQGLQLHDKVGNTSTHTNQLNMFFCVSNHVHVCIWTFLLIVCFVVEFVLAPEMGKTSRGETTFKAWTVRKVTTSTNIPTAA
jgi:hypothetical protein